VGAGRTGDGGGSQRVGHVWEKDVRDAESIVSFDRKKVNRSIDRFPSRALWSL